jgi:hypothetical protein
MLFNSDRPGGTPPFKASRTAYHGSAWGNMDIYVCLMTEDGWEKVAGDILGWLKKKVK